MDYTDVTQNKTRSRGNFHAYMDSELYSLNHKWIIVEQEGGAQLELQYLML